MNVVIPIFISPCFKDCKAEDEGDFSCTVTNSKGSDTLSFKLFVTVEGGMDFRAMLQKKKVKQKKIVVQKTEWIEPLFDQECQQGKDKQVNKNYYLLFRNAGSALWNYL